MARHSTRKQSKTERSIAGVQLLWHQAKQVIIGIVRVCHPMARGVYHPQPHSPVILGIVLSPHVDVVALERELWWRGLGLVERNGQSIAGADITTAVQLRRVKQARMFVTKQLRDAGVRGPVKRWE